MNGFQAQAHIGRTVMEMFPDWSQNYLPYLRRALQGEAITGVEIQRPSTKPGQTMTTLASYQPARDEAGEVIGVSVSVTDITEHKRAAKTLVEREEDQRYVFELNSQVQWIMDAGGKMLQVSSQWEQMTGLSKERTCNLGWLKALHTEDVEPTMNALHEALFTGQPFDMEFRIRSVAGTWMWMRSRGTPCHGPLGEITRWYGSIEDISEHRQTEYTLRKRVARSLGFPGAAPVSNQMENVLMWNADGKMRNSVHVSV
jgi:PAS domain S-box-containing protein